MPLAITAIGCVGAALKGGDVLAILDKWIAFAQLYVPVSMGVILGVSGAIKGVEAWKASSSG